MTALADRLVQELLQLPEKERLEIIERVYESIEVGFDDGSEIDLGPEWSEEIKRRIEAFQNGTAETITTDELFEYMRAEGGDAED